MYTWRTLASCVCGFLWGFFFAWQYTFINCEQDTLSPALLCVQTAVCVWWARVWLSHRSSGRFEVGGAEMRWGEARLDEAEEQTWEPSLLFSHLFCSAEVQEVTELLGVFVCAVRRQKAKEKRRRKGAVCKKKDPNAAIKVFLLVAIEGKHESLTHWHIPTHTPTNTALSHRWQSEWVRASWSLCLSVLQAPSLEPNFIFLLLFTFSFPVDMTLIHHLQTGSLLCSH